MTERNARHPFAILGRGAAPWCLDALVVKTPFRCPGVLALRSRRLDVLAHRGRLRDRRSILPHSLEMEANRFSDLSFDCLDRHPGRNTSGKVGHIRRVISFRLFDHDRVSHAHEPLLSCACFRMLFSVPGAKSTARRVRAVVLRLCEGPQPLFQFINHARQLPNPLSEPRSCTARRVRAVVLRLCEGPRPFLAAFQFSASGNLRDSKMLSNVSFSTAPEIKRPHFLAPFSSPSVSRPVQYRHRSRLKLPCTLPLPRQDRAGASSPPPGGANLHFPSQFPGCLLRLRLSRINPPCRAPVS